MTIMSLELPDYVSRLTEIGLETWAEEDRLLALQAAHDADPTDRSDYSMEVAQLFLEQAGLELESSERVTKIEIWNPYSARVWRVMQVVARSLGSELGLSSRFYELIEEDTDNIPKRSSILVTHSQSSDASLFLGDWDLTAEKPFYTQNYVTQNASLKNCLRVVEAVGGMIERADDLGRPLTDALQEIRSLDEARL